MLSLSTTQKDIWTHIRTHVPASKLLSCPHCPFVCAFKHHMQYHLNNHFGFKPFRCHLCSYRCNNKSMLNSHLKSHSGEYPFKCAECGYVSKYKQALYIHVVRMGHMAGDSKQSCLKGGGKTDVAMKKMKEKLKGVEKGVKKMFEKRESSNIGVMDVTKNVPKCSFLTRPQLPLPTLAIAPNAPTSLSLSNLHFFPALNLPYLFTKELSAQLSNMSTFSSFKNSFLQTLISSEGLPKNSANSSLKHLPSSFHRNLSQQNFICPDYESSFKAQLDLNSPIDLRLSPKNT